MYRDIPLQLQLKWELTDAPHIVLITRYMRFKLQQVSPQLPPHFFRSHSQTQPLKTYKPLLSLLLGECVIPNPPSLQRGFYIHLGREAAP
jgi:hypothetical protein